MDGELRDGTGSRNQMHRHALGRRELSHLMTSHELGLQDIGPRNGTGADDEEGGFEHVGV